MIRAAVLLGLLALLGASCVPQPPARPGFAANPAGCRVGSDDGPALSERGIGGTGGPSRSAERGIGGTGIVGVVTGFASVCVNGLEVAIDDATRIDLDGATASPGILRAGHLIVAVADEHGPGLRASRVSLRHAVIGPVTRIADEAYGTGLVVAGQRVLLPRGVLGPLAATVHIGDWLAISGIDDTWKGVIATRVDQAPPGRVMVHGELRAHGTTWRIGDLAVTPPRGIVPVAGERVTASGSLLDGVLQAETLRPDLLMTDAADYFGSRVDRLEITAYARVQNGRLHFAGGSAPAENIGNGELLAVLSLARERDGSLVLTRVQPVGDSGSAGAQAAVGGAPIGGPGGPRGGAPGGAGGGPQSGGPGSGGGAGAGGGGHGR